MEDNNTELDEALIDAVHDLLMNGLARWQIKKKIDEYAVATDQEPPTGSELDAAIAVCVDNWIDDAGQSEREVHAFHLALRKSLIERAISINDYPTAARIAQDLAKLQDQYRQTTNAARSKPARQRRIAKLRGAPVGHLSAVPSND